MKSIIKHFGILFLCIFLFNNMLKSQDKILLKNGDEIKCKVSDVTNDQIKYKKYDNLNGPDYSCDKTDVFKITYESGKTEVMSTSGNNNENTLVLKKRIAVQEFKNKVTSQKVQTKSGYFGYSSPEEASANLTDMLINEISQTGKFIVVERDRMDAIMKEQDFNSTERVSQPSAVKKNKILGYQLLLTGSITEFSLNREESKGNYIYVKTKKVSTTARVVVSLRLVNASTGEIILSESGKGEETSSSSGVNVMGVGEDASSADLSILDKAKKQAIQNCVELISKYSSKVPWNGNVVKVNANNTILMTPGSSGNVKAGMKFSVFSKGEEVIDPETGMSLGFESKKIGMIEVTEDFGSEGKACTATIISGQGFKSGDIIKEEK